MAHQPVTEPYELWFVDERLLFDYPLHRDNWAQLSGYASEYRVHGHSKREAVRKFAMGRGEMTPSTHFS